MGGMRWELAMCLALAWFICYFCIWKGPKSTGKVRHTNACLPSCVGVGLRVKYVCFITNLTECFHAWMMYMMPSACLGICVCRNSHFLFTEEVWFMHLIHRNSLLMKHFPLLVLETTPTPPPLLRHLHHPLPPYLPAWFSYENPPQGSSSILRRTVRRAKEALRFSEPEWVERWSERKKRLNKKKWCMWKNDLAHSLNEKKKTAPLCGKTYIALKCLFVWLWSKRGEGFFVAGL